VKTSFDKWWEHFLTHMGLEEPHESARRLRRKLLRVKVADRPEFVKRLLEKLLKKHHAYGVALLVLEGITDPAHLDDIANSLLPLPGPLSDDEESHLSDLIRILAAANKDSLLPAVEEYLLRRDIGPHWPSVPWAVWPHRKRLFGKAWLRFFSQHDPADWRGTLIIKSFLTEPEAVRVIKHALEVDSPDAWEPLRESLIRQAGLVSWLSDDQREALDWAVS
jgi:hypothetical protein